MDNICASGQVGHVKQKTYAEFMQSLVDDWEKGV